MQVNKFDNLTRQISNRVSYESQKLKKGLVCDFDNLNLEYVRVSSLSLWIAKNK